MPLQIEILPILKDNYAYLLINYENRNAAVIDPGEAEPVLDFLKRNHLTLTHILNTHHHGDHIAGNKVLRAEYQAALVGPAKEENRIGTLDIALHEGDDFEFEGCATQILETPGHTSGHICFYFPALKAAFTGDTLFSMGCGRLFEGTAAQMWDSFQKLISLPDETRVFCGHEYTLANAAFCQEIEPENKDLKNRIEDVKALRAADQPSLPSTIGLEKKTNAFLRAGSASEFARLRTLKDHS